jgi:SAM-dependent methyltransferase
MIRTLKSKAELTSCRERLRQRGLDFTDPRAFRFWRWPYKLRYRLDLPVADPLKSWDVATALEELERLAPDKSTPILDMGCFNSEIVYVLHRLGYRCVHGCDLNPSCRWMPFWNHIKYAFADLTRTPYRDKSFGVITCLSVVEHGVPIDAFVEEVARLIRPGGLFLFSTDFDAIGSPHQIDPNLRLFGQPWTLFTPETLDALISRFRQRGFTLSAPEQVDTSHVDCPVHWQNENYTFVLVGLKAPE